jgi:predicted alpha/beta-fold hydrolase
MNRKFKPAWWLPGAHLQTLWPALLRRKKALPVRDERLELADGDFLDLSWVGEGNTPLVLILHGLNGSVNSHYVNGLLNSILQRGWRGVLMHFRGCSKEPNRLAKSYHSGETADLNTVIAEILHREPNVQLYVVGYSLGGNVLLKALGTGAINKRVKAAVAVSVPFELAKTANHMSKGLSRIYQWHLVSGLISKYKQKFKTIKSPANSNVNKLGTFWKFDNDVTAPLHGFKDAADYYHKSSSRQYLTKIEITTLVIHAKDDPFTPVNSVPGINDLSDQVLLELYDSGGHVGFVTGKYPWRAKYWLEHKILDFFDTVSRETNIKK